MHLLDVNNLTVKYHTKNGDAIAVDNVSFYINHGETLGIVGESGCGKTTIAKAIMQLMPKNSTLNGEINFKNNNLLDLNINEIRKYRWDDISMISQSAMNSLNPVVQIGSQIIEAVQAHRNVNLSTAKIRLKEVFDLVGLNLERANDYPHQFSGGMKQRAVIAMSLVLNPDLIIADEPTTALDVLVQDQIIHKIKELLEKLNNAMILITHDIAVVAETCEKMMVMYAGKVMEISDTESLFYDPYNPYTLGLQNAFPSVMGEKSNLISIPGFPPSLIKIPKGCRFSARCPFSIDICKEEEPTLVEVKKNHFNACHRVRDIEMMRVKSKKEETWTSVKAS